METLGRVSSEKLGLKGKRGENPPLDPQPWVGTKATIPYFLYGATALLGFMLGKVGRCSCRM